MVVMREANPPVLCSRFSLRKGSLSGDATAAIQYLKEPTRKVERHSSSGIVVKRKNGFKLKEEI